MTASRRRPMTRIGDLLPDAARGLGLEDELRLSRAMATFEAIVAEREPAAAGACRVIRLDGFSLVVEADAPIVAQELRLRGTELLTAAVFGASVIRTGIQTALRPAPPTVTSRRPPNRKRPAWPSDSR